MKVIKEIQTDSSSNELPAVLLKVDRRVLAKRRWRGEAVGGRGLKSGEWGFQSLSFCVFDKPNHARVTENVSLGAKQIQKL